ncbi:MAG: signal recognition particle-docking protein FtsY [Gammaproteobacteria bacterium]|nr:signal recognition particle-docking protein FtsY [Gammaproteobacteria bacterium]
MSALFSRHREDNAESLARESAGNAAAAADDGLDAGPDYSPNASLDAGLDATRKGLWQKLGHVFKGSFDLDDALFEELEDVLVSSDVGVEASVRLIEQLRNRVSQDKVQSAAGVVQALRTEIAESLRPAQQSWPALQQPATLPYVLLVVGVNGVGKTTTIAKLAKQLTVQGRSVMLAAGDTFRAAAVEQLQSWGDRLAIPVIAQQHGADAAAVAHDALSAAQARGVEVLIIDTAGRLHTQGDLMEQLQKVVRVIKKLDPDAPHEVMQIVDAGTGQNALTQLKHFHSAVAVSSLCISKLDGSAKGGVVIALTEALGLPIRFIGVGEGQDDLQPFDAARFAVALIGKIEVGDTDA